MSHLTYSREGNAHYPAIEIAGPLTGGSVGIAGGPVFLANGGRAFEADQTMAAGQQFAFSAAASAQQVTGLDHLFNNDNQGLWGMAGSGNGVVWGLKSAPHPDVPPTDPAQSTKLTVSKKVTGDLADYSHAFAMETLLAAPYQNVRAAIYNEDGSLDYEATEKISILCWDGPAQGLCPANEYGCATQTLVTYGLKDGQHLSVWGIASGTAFTTHEVDPLVRGVAATNFGGEAVATDKGIYDPSQAVDGAMVAGDDAGDSTLVSGAVGASGTAVAYINALADGSLRINLAVKGTYGDLSHPFAFEATVEAPASVVKSHVQVVNADGSVDSEATQAVSVTGDDESAQMTFFLKDGQNLDLALWPDVLVEVEQSDPLVVPSAEKATSQSPYISSVAVDGDPPAQGGDGRKASAATSAHGTVVSYIDELPLSPATGLEASDSGPKTLLSVASGALGALFLVPLAWMQVARRRMSDGR